MPCMCRFGFHRRFLGLPEKLRPRLFAGFKDAELEAILQLASHRKLAAGVVVIHEGNPAQRLYLLVGGQATQFAISPDGQKVPLRWLAAGQVFGAMAFVDVPQSYLASVEMVAAGCALSWERRDVRDLAVRFPRLLLNAFAIAETEIIAWLVARRVSLATDDAQSRVARLLSSLACGIGESISGGTMIRISNEELAAGANVTTFTLSRYLRAWQREGVLKKGRGRLLLLRPDRLII